MLTRKRNIVVPKTSPITAVEWFLIFSAFCRRDRPPVILVIVCPQPECHREMSIEDQCELESGWGDEAVNSLTMPKIFSLPNFQRIICDRCARCLRQMFEY